MIKAVAGGGGKVRMEFSCGVVMLASFSVFTLLCEHFLTLSEVHFHRYVLWHATAVRCHDCSFQSFFLLQVAFGQTRHGQSTTKCILYYAAISRINLTYRVVFIVQGMRVCMEKADFLSQLSSAQGEAMSSFGNSEYVQYIYYVCVCVGKFSVRDVRIASILIVGKYSTSIPCFCDDFFLVRECAVYLQWKSIFLLSPRVCFKERSHRECVRWLTVSRMCWMVACRIFFLARFLAPGARISTLEQCTMHKWHFCGLSQLVIFVLFFRSFCVIVGAYAFLIGRIMKASRMVHARVSVASFLRELHLSNYCKSSQ